jgi:hypothetical protein
MFLRLGWVVGQAGVIGVLQMLMLGTLQTVLTILSLSAICSNGSMKGGGAYFVISRCMGPAFGASIGIMMYLATVVGAALYAMGVASEIDNMVSPGSVDIASGYWARAAYCAVTLLLIVFISFRGAESFGKFNQLLMVVQMTAIAFCAAVFLVGADPSLGLAKPHLAGGGSFLGANGATLSENLYSSFLLDELDGGLNSTMTWFDRLVDQAQQHSATTRAAGAFSGGGSGGLVVTTTNTRTNNTANSSSVVVTTTGTSTTSTTSTSSSEGNGGLVVTTSISTTSVTDTDVHAADNATLSGGTNTSGFNVTSAAAIAAAAAAAGAGADSVPSSSASSSSPSSSSTLPRASSSSSSSPSEQKQLDAAAVTAAFQCFDELGVGSLCNWRLVYAIFFPAVTGIMEVSQPLTAL